MERKSFLGLLGGVALPLGSLAKDSIKAKKVKIPSYLQKGDTVGIVCPAGYSTSEDIAPAVAQLQAWGYRVNIGNTIGKRDFTFGGSDAVRAADMQAMFDDPQVKAILCATGGYGTVRMIDLLNFQSFIRSPKWVIGFSDVTVLHSHIHQVYNIATLHAKMCGSFPKDPLLADPVQTETIDAIHKVLSGEKIIYPLQPTATNRIGKATGMLVGGNLRILENMNGSISSMDTRGKILFIEDVSEPLYNIDRMLCNMLRAGKLEGLKGLIVGGFTSMKPDTPDSPFGRDVPTMVMEKVAQFNYPVCFQFPVGHQKNNFPLKCGVLHTLDVGAEAVTLTEL